MLQAVIDSNFWLSTHVITVCMGYSAMFLAGFLGCLFIIKGIFTEKLSQKEQSSLHNMTIGVLCFAMFFSTIGTILGGIWADQSWGRFWGWDPKENGAILIVLWIAIILHAKFMGAIKQRGIMISAVFGNIITSFSWFGVNMLGVGLHSYGFMESALLVLIGFIVIQLYIMAIGFIPEKYWKSTLSHKK
jgi:ABC-type transport system involved in cytochrome c biogenesis permease subunit